MVITRKVIEHLGKIWESGKTYADAALVVGASEEQAAKWFGRFERAMRVVGEKSTDAAVAYVIKVWASPK